MGGGWVGGDLPLLIVELGLGCIGVGVCVWLERFKVAILLNAPVWSADRLTLDEPCASAHLPKGEPPENGFADSLLLRCVEIREGTHQLSRLLLPPLSL